MPRNGGHRAGEEGSGLQTGRRFPPSAAKTRFHGNHLLVGMCPCRAAPARHRGVDHSQYPATEDCRQESAPTKQDCIDVVIVHRTRILIRHHHFGESRVLEGATVECGRPGVLGLGPCVDEKDRPARVGHGRRDLHSRRLRLEDSAHTIIKMRSPRTPSAPQPAAAIESGHDTEPGGQHAWNGHRKQAHHPGRADAPCALRVAGRRSPPVLPPPSPAEAAAPARYHSAAGG